MLQDVMFDCSQTMVQQVLPQHMHVQWLIYHTFLLVHGACKTQNMEQLNSRLMEQWNNFCCVETWFASQPRKYIRWDSTFTIGSVNLLKIWHTFCLYLPGKSQVL